jgi:ankyrin repeat protein
MRGLLTFLLVVAPLFAHASEADRQLFDAARKGGTSAIVRALDQGANVNSLDSDTPVRLSPLHVAVNRNNLEAVVVLLKRGADPNLGSNGESPLYIAASRDTRILKTLLEHGADPNAKTKLNYTALGIAAACKPDIFLSLKKKGGYVGRLPDCPASIRLLLAAGAKVNDPGWHGNPPTTEAVYWNNPENVRLLAQAGADINLKNEFAKTPLAIAFDWYAIERNARQMKRPHSMAPMLPMIELLLRLGADPNHQDNGAFDEVSDSRVVPYSAGYTLLCLAARNGWYQAAELLLKHGADPGIPRTDGALPASLAEQNRHPRTAQLIRAYMKRKPANNASHPTAVGGG